MRRSQSNLPAEEAALLGRAMEDLEMQQINLDISNSRRLSSDGSCTEVRVQTDRGDIIVACRGDRKKPAILTYHDIGLNYSSNFQNFFNTYEMRGLTQHFALYHVNAPGQEEGAAKLPDNYVYPSMDELARQLLFVVGHFGIKYFIGFGVGAGANVLARFGKMYPSKVEGMILVNCSPTQAGWLEWGYQKVNALSLRKRGMTDGVADYMVWHHFGRNPSSDTRQVYRDYFTNCINASNLAMFINSYIQRTDLGIGRKCRTIGATILNLTGANSPHINDTISLNGRLDPALCSWMKISDSAMVLEEQTDVTVEAFTLFLQGLGYVNARRTPKQRSNSKVSLAGSAVSVPERVSAPQVSRQRSASDGAADSKKIRDSHHRKSNK